MGKNIDLRFLKSNRFWAVVLEAIVLYLYAKNIIGEAELTFVTAVVAPFVTIRTVDKFNER